MICGLAENTAKNGMEAPLLRAAQEHGAALRQQPGCIATYVLTEKGSRDVVALSVFDSEESFEKAVVATRPVIMKHQLPDLLEGEPRFRILDVR